MALPDRIKLLGECDRLVGAKNQIHDNPLLGEPVTELFLVLTQVLARAFKFDPERYPIQGDNEIRAAQVCRGALVGAVPDESVPFEQTPIGEFTLIFALEPISLGRRMGVVRVRRMDPRLAAIKCLVLR
jgi:hypothetical protein